MRSFESIGIAGADASLGGVHVSGGRVVWNIQFQYLWVFDDNPKMATLSFQREQTMSYHASKVHILLYFGSFPWVMSSQECFSSISRSICARLALFSSAT